MSPSHIEKFLKNEVYLNLRVLGYKTDDKGWAAHCLETDLVGYASSFKKALKDLEDITIMQISFAIQKKLPILLDSPAPEHIVQKFEELTRSKLQAYAKRGKSIKNNEVALLPLPTHLPEVEFAIVSP